MDTRYILNTRRHARGAVRPLILAILAIFVLLAVGAWFLIIKPHQELMMADSAGHPSVPAASAARAAAPPVDVSSMDVNQLLAEARTAMNEERYLAPTGNNAFEFYLRALVKDPGNKVASDALRETFPFAANSAEQAINSSDFNEAQRQIDLLAKADPTNFTLTILRSKLDAQRKTLDKQQQQELDQQKAQQVASQKAATEKLAAEQLAEQQKAQLTEQQKEKQATHTAQAASQSVVAAAGPAVTGAPAAAAAGDTAGGETADAVLLQGASPSYPATALRAHQGGWVVVSFSIGTDGRTEDIRVVDAQPRHVFDRAATEAIRRYRFKPAIKDGAPVSTARQLKIEFNL